MILERALSLADLSVEQAELFFLVLFRISFVVFLLPVFSNKSVLSRIKVGLIVFLAILIFPQIDTSAVVLQPGPSFLFVLLLQEALIGLLMGFAASLLFIFVDVGGGIVARDIGLAMARMMDPSSGSPSTSMTQFFNILFMLFFLATNGHHFFFQAIVESFHFVPLGGVNLAFDKFALVLSIMVAESFVVGLKMASPVMITVLLTLVALALVTRAMPNLNVWMISIPIKVVLASLTIIFTLPLLFRLFDSTLLFIQQHLLVLMQLAGGGGGS